MYLYIDAEGNIKMDKASVMLVPEFKEMVDSKLFGWNFFQYTCLFTSRTPFGMLPDEIRKKLDKLQFKSKKSFNKIIIEALITHLDREKI